METWVEKWENRTKSLVSETSEDSVDSADSETWEDLRTSKGKETDRKMHITFPDTL